MGGAVIATRVRGLCSRTSTDESEEVERNETDGPFPTDRETTHNIARKSRFSSLPLGYNGPGGYILARALNGNELE